MSLPKKNEGCVPGGRFDGGGGRDRENCGVSAGLVFWISERDSVEDNGDGDVWAVPHQRERTEAGGSHERDVVNRGRVFEASRGRTLEELSGFKVFRTWLSKSAISTL